MSAVTGWGGSAKYLSSKVQHTTILRRYSPEWGKEQMSATLTFATMEEDSSQAHIKGFVCRRLLGLWFNLKRVTTLLRQQLDSVSLWWQCNGRSGRTLTGKEPAIELSTVADMRSSHIPASASSPHLVAEQQLAAAVRSMKQLSVRNNLFNPGV